MTRKDLLDKAFLEATRGIIINSIDDNDVLINALTSSIKLFAQKEGIDFTDSEIRATIIVNLDPLLKLSSDLFLHQI